jgi:protein-tyrosine phosphatase
LIVCLGNICRSPLAEGIMRQLVEQEGLDWEISSAGTGDWHIGRKPDHRGIAVAKQFGYDISEQKAQLFTPHLFNTFDYILVMDKKNYRDVLRLAANNDQRKKVRFFLADEGEVIDPYHYDHLFEPVFKEVETRCKRLIAEFRQLKVH